MVHRRFVSYTRRKSGTARIYLPTANSDVEKASKVESNCGGQPYTGYYPIVFVITQNLGLASVDYRLYDNILYRNIILFRFLRLEATTSKRVPIYVQIII